MENLKEIKPIADFNWDEFEQGEVACSASRKEQEAAYDGTLSNVKDQEIVIGTVTKIGKREVLVNIGFKSEGAINSAEFRYNPELQVGDKALRLLLLSLKVARRRKPPGGQGQGESLHQQR